MARLRRLIATNEELKQIQTSRADRQLTKWNKKFRESNAPKDYDTYLQGGGKKRKRKRQRQKTKVYARTQSNTLPGL